MHRIARIVSLVLLGCFGGFGCSHHGAAPDDHDGPQGALFRNDLVYSGPGWENTPLDGTRIGRPETLDDARKYFAALLYHHLGRTDSLTALEHALTRSPELAAAVAAESLDMDGPNLHALAVMSSAFAKWFDASSSKLDYVNSVFDRFPSGSSDMDEQIVDIALSIGEDGLRVFESRKKRLPSALRRAMKSKLDSYRAR